MFFADPVAAFGNAGRALRPAGCRSRLLRRVFADESVDGLAQQVGLAVCHTINAERARCLPRVRPPTRLRSQLAIPR